MKPLVVTLLSLVAGIAVWLLVGLLEDEAPVEIEQPEVSLTAASEEIEEAPRRFLDFDDALISEVVGVFNQRNTTQIELAESSIGEMRITASLRSDNPDVFVNLLELTMDLRAERESESKIVLHRNDEP
ncbi:MAG: ferric-dicitrate binding protein FerR (iron transport regulator) [Candidatus Pelagisphaera sp.]|jgi:ferric-dicitrate binding protein FerR (iron transport regulator)